MKRLKNADINTISMLNNINVHYNINISHYSISILSYIMK